MNIFFEYMFYITLSVSLWFIFNNNLFYSILKLFSSVSREKTFIYVYIFFSFYFGADFDFGQAPIVWDHFEMDLMVLVSSLVYLVGLHLSDYSYSCSVLAYAEAWVSTWVCFPWHHWVEF